MTSYRYHEYPRETLMEQLIKSNCAEMSEKMAVNLRVRELERISLLEMTIEEAIEYKELTKPESNERNTI